MAPRVCPVGSNSATGTNRSGAEIAFASETEHEAPLVASERVADEESCRRGHGDADADQSHRRLVIEHPQHDAVDARPARQDRRRADQDEPEQEVRTFDTCRSPAAEPDDTDEERDTGGREEPEPDAGTPARAMIADACR